MDTELSAQSGGERLRMWLWSILIVNKPFSFPGAQTKKTDRPLFSAERAMLAAKQADKPAAVAGNGEIMAALAAMQAEILGLRQDMSNMIAGKITVVADVAPPVAKEEDPDLVAHKEDIAHLKTELRALSVCINQTKAEIASIHASSDQDDHLSAVSNELDAVVASTEKATSDILDAVEAAEAQVRAIKSHVTEPYVGGLVDEILERLINVMEACNFQDLTGQRITKVVNTLKFVEERVNAMIHIWGEEAVVEASEDAVRFGGHRPDAEDNHLLNGPQLDGDGCNQADIDAMFG